MNNRPKEAAYDDFIEAIKESWTWQRMTDDECKIFIDEIMNHPALKPVGTWLQRWNFYQSVYSAYLLGLGYRGFHWREDQVTTWSAR